MKSCSLLSIAALLAMVVGVGCHPTRENVSSKSLWRDSRFVGGTPAALGDFPATVRLVAGDEPLCSGAIIAVDRILTAAHCLVGTAAGIGPGDAITVLVGTNSRNFKKFPNVVSDLMVPPGWVKAYQSLYAPPKEIDTAPDIAVIVLGSPMDVPPTSIARPEMLPKASEARVVIGGFGAEDDESPPPPVSRGRLKTARKRISNVTKSFFSVPYSDLDGGLSRVGVGDSGAPAYLDDDHLAIVGVVSMGNALDDEKATTLTRVDAAPKGLWK